MKEESKKPSSTEYEGLGFKCGLEVHVQLDTPKLFCSCPSTLRKDEPDYEVERKLRAVVGETGEKDVATKLEEHKDKTFFYQGYDDTTCLVELDAEPPHMIDEQALRTGVEAAKLLNMHVLGKVFVMRKTVVDGSNTSGFQRTLLLAEDGFVETSEGKVGVDMLSLEEDAARKIKETKNKVYYRLDRLGIPLIELRTEPGIKNPRHAVETAKKIGALLRMTGRTKRGLGTIRQDVNVSIKEGTRIEIKGVQDLKLMPEIIENEVRRQRRIVELSKKLRKKSSPKKLKKKFVNVSKTFQKSKSFLKGKNVLGARLPGLKGLVGEEILPDRRLGTELADIAKIMGLKGIIHSDELPAYKITKKEVKKIKKQLKCKKSDAFIIVAGPENKTRKTLSLSIDRLKKFFKGVPEDVRRALPDATTSFLRPIPGAARMYPETDLPPISVDEKALGVEEVETPEERFRKLTKKGLSKELANQVIQSRKLLEFEELLQYKNVEPNTIAKILFGAQTELRKEGVKRSVSMKDFHDLFELLDQKKISKDSYPRALKMLVQGKTKKEVEEELGLMSEEKLKRIIKKVLKKHGDESFKALMGFVMKEAKGRADGKKVSELIKKQLK